MSKKPPKTRPRAAPKSRAAATKRPAVASEHDTTERIARALETIAAQLSASAPASERGPFVFQRRRLRLASRWPAGAGAARQPRRSRPAQGHRPDARHPDREYRAFCRWASRQQCAVVGRARHGQILAGQGDPCQHQCRPQARRPPQADRDPSRGYREPAGPDGPAARVRFSFHRVLRRFVVRRQRRLLQVAEGGAGRRHRGPAGECHPLRHVQPPASAWRAT